MYGNGNEKNKIVLLRSSLLIGLYHSDIDEYNQPWYWTGVATSTCQVWGLDHNVDSQKTHSCVTERQRSFWRRLWWITIFRDRWLSLTMGIPPRINLDSCDTPFPSSNDLLYYVTDLEESVASLYLPCDLERLANYWVMLISLSHQLGDVLAIKHQSLRPRLSCHEIDAFEKRLMQCSVPDQYEPGLPRLSRFYSHHVHLHKQLVLLAPYEPLTVSNTTYKNLRALINTFYCSFGAQFPHDLPLAENQDWQRRMKLKANAAACRTNEIVGILVQENLLGFAGPMT